MGTEMDNLRTALGSACDSGDAESALMIAGGLGWCWQQNGRASEGARWLEQACAFEGEATPATRAWALGWRKLMCRYAGLADPGPTDDELMAIAGPADDPGVLGWMQAIVADRPVGRGDVQGATKWFDAARAIFVAQNDIHGDCMIAFIDAHLAMLAGDNDAAERSWARMADMGRQSGSITFEAGADVALSNFAELRGDYRRATELLETSRRLEAEMGFHARDVTSVVRLANLAALMGDPDGASALSTRPTGWRRTTRSDQSWPER
jgi:hypothetical protein